MVFPNTIAYACQCKDGFTGDGYNCQEKGMEYEKYQNRFDITIDLTSRRYFMTCILD